MHLFYTVYFYILQIWVQKLMRTLENIRNIRNSIDIWNGVWYNMGTELNEN